MDGEISPEELRSILESDGETESLRIVDIRNPESFARGHIPGSENIPAPELTGRVEELDGAGRVVTVCPHGQASVQAARLVGSYRGVGGPVESLHGGLEAWDGALEADDSRGNEGDGDATAPF